MAPKHTSRTSEALSHIHVVVIDDDARIGLIIRSVLEGLGFTNIRIFTDVEESIAYLKLHIADMIICDWQMSPTNGIDFTRYLRQKIQNTNRTVPVIMLSGNSEQSHVEMARDNGVTEYVIKPFTARSLCSRIISVIENPRSFILAPEFQGPNRRRKKLPASKERRKKT